jgi:hypothetical protein
LKIVTGNFQQGETVTITKENSSTFQVNLDSSFGDSSVAQTGQIGPLIAVDSSDGTLGSATVIKVGANVIALLAILISIIEFLLYQKLIQVMNKQL